MASMQGSREQLDVSCRKSTPFESAHPFLPSTRLGDGTEVTDRGGGRFAMFLQTGPITFLFTKDPCGSISPPSDSDVAEPAQGGLGRPTMRPCTRWIRTSPS